MNSLSPPEEEIYDQVAARRGPSGLLPLDHALLHSMPIAQGWTQLFSAIRTKTTLAPDILYLAICRVALHNQTQIPWKNYLESLKRLESTTNEQLEVVEDRDPLNQGSLSEKQWAALKYADAMTKNVVVEDSVFQQVKSAGFTERQIVELTLTIAAYNCVCRFLVALEIEDKSDS